MSQEHGRKVNQIGIVVPDIDAAVRFYSDVMGFGPFNVLERPKEKCILRGKETEFRLKTAFCMNAGVQLELIQVIEGRSAHSEFLEKHPNGGIHHLGYFVDDLDAEISKFSAVGIEVLARGEFMGTRWAYMDSESVCGVIHEFIELPKPKKRRKKPKKAE